MCRGGLLNLLLLLLETVCFLLFCSFLCLKHFSEAVVLCLSLFLRFLSSTSVDLAPSYLRSKHSFIPEATVASFPLSLFSHFLCADGGEGREGRERGTRGGWGRFKKEEELRFEAWGWALREGCGRCVCCGIAPIRDWWIVLRRRCIERHRHSRFAAIICLQPFADL